jgi:hypothetical protein
MIWLLIARQGLQAPDMFHTCRQLKSLVRAPRPSHAPREAREMGREQAGHHLGNSLSILLPLRSS